MRMLGRAWRTGLVAVALAAMASGCGDDGVVTGDLDAAEVADTDGADEGDADAGDAGDGGDEDATDVSDAGPDGADDTADGGLDAEIEDVDLDAPVDVVPDEGPETTPDVVEDVAGDVPVGDEGSDGQDDAELPPGCALDADCVGTPGSGVCRPAVCDPGTGTCSPGAALADGEVCDDGNACSLGDQCKAGKCGGTSALVCADGNPCTDDACQPKAGCVYKNNFAACDDGDACTVGDACVGGKCLSGSAACEDGSPCTVDACDPETGACTNTADDTLPCDDGSACTLGDACVAGVCVPGLLNGCDDGNPCTADGCVGDVTCQHTALHNLPCDDGEPCTAGDVCKTGTCTPTGPAKCDDGEACTADECVAGVGCVTTPLTGSACDDDSACTTGDVCSAAGVCEGGALLDCDDGDVCTDDGCDALKGCVHADNTSVCDDGSACTTGDACLAGQCVGAAVDCDDADACTLDACDPLIGCEHVSTASACDDGVACTLDGCDSELGCVSEPDDAACSEAGVCDPAQGCVDGATLLVVTRLLLLPVDVAPEAQEGAGQWIEVTNLGSAPVDLARLSFTNAAGAVADIAPLVGAGPEVWLAPGERLVGLDAPAEGEVPAGFDFVYGEAGDAFFLDPASDLLLLGDSAGPLDVVAIDGVVGALGPLDLPLSIGHPTALDSAAVDLGYPSANDDGAAFCIVLPELEDPRGAEPPDCTRAVLNEVSLTGPDGARYVEVHLPAGGLADGLAVRVVAADGEPLGTWKLDGRIAPGDAALVLDGAAGVTLPVLTDGSVQLLRKGSLLDVVGFGTLEATGDGKDDLPLVEGAAAVPLAPGQVLVREIDGVDSDDNVVDWQLAETGSPGTLSP